MAPCIKGDNSIIRGEKGNLMIKVVAALSIAVEQNQRLALALFDIVSIRLYKISLDIVDESNVLSSSFLFKSIKTIDFDSKYSSKSV